MPTKPKIPAVNTLIEVENADKITKRMLYFITCFCELKDNFVSNLIKFNLGIKNAQSANAKRNTPTSNLFEISALLKPPVKINVIA